MSKFSLLLILLSNVFGMHCFAKVPDCSGAEQWPASSAYRDLKNEGVLFPDKVDLKKTKGTLIASEKISKNLYHQVYLFVFSVINGASIKAITVSDSSAKECSVGDVKTYLISKEL